MGIMNVLRTSMIMNISHIRIMGMFQLVWLQFNGYTFMIC